MSNFENLYLNNQLCFALYSATHAVTRSYREHLSEIGLTYPQYLIMLVLWQYQNQTIVDLAKKLHREAHALMPMLKRLEQAGFIRLAHDSQDQTSINVLLTERGKQIHEQTSLIQQEVSCETGLTELEYKELRDKLENMLSNFQLTLQLRKAEASSALSSNLKQTNTARHTHVKAFYTAKHGDSD